MGEKRVNNSGFSLIELVIVIAVIAILTAILAPQYLKYVHDAKISTDLNNAEEIAKSVSVAVADGSLPLAAAGSTKEVTVADIPNVTVFPQSKVNAGYTWKVTVNAYGVEQVTLGGYEIWPDPDAANGYRTKH